MTTYREWFTTFNSGNFEFVYIGNDKVCTIIRIGQIKIVMDDDDV